MVYLVRMNPFERSLADGVLEMRGVVKSLRLFAPLLVCLSLMLDPLNAVGAGTVRHALPGAEPLDAELQARIERELAVRGAGYEPRTRHRNQDGSPIHSNRLLLEGSPYLQQHAHNPVNWYPWGDEAFADARRLGRPVLVSIDYSTCHWCHVMEEESFEDLETAEYLNAHLITIKVDREARPDVDAIYMSALHAMGQLPARSFAPGADDEQALLAREKPSRDGAVPAGNSIEAGNLLRLAAFTSNDVHLERLGQLYSAFGDLFEQSPTSLSSMLITVSDQVAGLREVVVVAPETGGEFDAMLQPLRERFVPNRVLVVVREGEPQAHLVPLIPIARDRPAINGEVTAYVCENHVCKYLTRDPGVFRSQLEKGNALSKQFGKTRDQ